MTVVSNNLLSWFTQFGLWAAAAEKDCEAATKEMFGTWGNFKEWTEEGAGWMQQVNQKPEGIQDLKNWLDTGAVDVYTLAKQADQHSLEYIHWSDDKDESSNVEALDQLILETFGRVLAATKSTFPEGAPPEQQKLLWTILDMYDATSCASSSPAYESWLKDLASEHLWAQQTLAEWTIFHHQERPAWNWIFNDTLLENTTTDFLKGILGVFDPPFDSRGVNNQKDHLDVMASGAPQLFIFLNQAHTSYTALMGAAPRSDGQEKYNFCIERAKIVAHMLAQQTGEIHTFELPSNFDLSSA